MKHLLTLLLAALCLTASARDYTQYVNPLMGTQSEFALSAGNTYPAIALPWGMNFWTPQTGEMGDGWQYTYTAHQLRGFKQTHQPSPWINDYGQFAIMPMTGRPIADERERASWFSHKAETARPNYYQVYLADYDINAELTPTERACLFRFTFPEGKSYINVDAYDQGSHIRILPAERKIVGYTTRNNGGVGENFRNYFVLVFDHPFTYTATYAADAKDTPVSLDSLALTQTTYHAGAIVGFDTRRGEKVHVRVASSFISEAQAETNLTELGTADFETLRQRGTDRWNEVLGRIDVEGGCVTESEDDLRTFYSCLYRSLLFPRMFWERDATGHVHHYSPYNGRVCDGYLYTDTGFWDTFRCLFPLLDLVYPSESLKMQEGLLNAYRESGFFPEWASPGHRPCMVGNNSAAVLADAFVKGIRVSDTKTLMEGLLNATHAVHPEVKSTGRIGYEHYNALGYVPCDIGIKESAARTLEYCFDDWCILQVAEALGQPRDTLRTLRERALNYRHLFRPDYRLMSGRKADGTFADDFSPLKWGGDFTEGNAWHYTWSVFHDPQGLIDLMGGKHNFTAMLDSLFTLPPLYDDSYYGFPIHEIREMTVMNMGNYAHGNQPVQHAIYLYDWAGEPWKAQYWLREVMRRMYAPTPDGYCGDEDNGQTSAWYVWSALGLYPVCPASTHYAIGSPAFRHATLHLENGHDITIETAGGAKHAPYIQHMTLNGKAWDANYLDHFTLTRGATLHYDMSTTPNTQRGTSAKAAPYSFSR